MEYRNSFRPARIFGITSFLIWVVLQVLVAFPVAAQTRVPLQPFAQQVRQVETSLAYLGQPTASVGMTAVVGRDGAARQKADASPPFAKNATGFGMTMLSVCAMGRRSSHRRNAPGLIS